MEKVLSGITFTTDVVINGFDNGPERSFKSGALVCKFDKGTSFWVVKRAVDVSMFSECRLVGELSRGHWETGKRSEEDKEVVWVILVVVVGGEDDNGMRVEKKRKVLKVQDGLISSEISA